MQITWAYPLIVFALFASLRGEVPGVDDDLNGLNYTTLWEIVKMNTNPFLQDLHGHWSFNDTSDITKYEEFDHTRFQGKIFFRLLEYATKLSCATQIDAAVQGTQVFTCFSCFKRGEWSFLKVRQLFKRTRISREAKGLCIITDEGALKGWISERIRSTLSYVRDADDSPERGSREPSLEELLEKVKEMQRAARRRSQPVKPTTATEDLPVFDTSLVTNVTAQLGGTAFLHCRVKNLNNRAVTWVRKRDWHILTTGVLTYTNDERFQVLHAEGSDDWTLHIKYVQKRDTGAYQCHMFDNGQDIRPKRYMSSIKTCLTYGWVPTGKGSLTHYFNLIVVVPTAYILGKGDYYIGHGSTISLVCIIENSPTPPQFVMWFHNENMINYEDGSEESQRVKVVTEPGGDKTHSRLLITEATSKHSGNYTCRASNTEPDSVYVFVSTDDDNIAAIQRQNALESNRPCILLFIMTVARFLLNQWSVTFYDFENVFFFKFD